MEYIVTAEEMKYYDRTTIEEIGIPSLVLMERAALSVLNEIEAADKKGKVLILAGCGNNGGDGLALARLLAEREYPVEVVVCGNPIKATNEWKKQADILQNYAVTIHMESPFKGRNLLKKEYTVLVDALFGVGLSREVTGDYAEMINIFNELEGYKIAIDIPSGIHSDTGEVMGCAVRADVTVCLGFPKRGHFFYPGYEYCGQVKVREIGIGKAAFRGRMPGMYRYTEDIKKLLPKRSPNGNKGTFGKVLLVAGSRNMAGAAVLSAKSCYQTGAGMVKVVTPECNRIILQETVPEALLWTYPDKINHSDETNTAHEGATIYLRDSDLGWANVCAIGPGLGTDEAALCLLKQLLRNSQNPLVIDADGLNLLAKYPDLQEEIAVRTAEGRSIIMTPHVAELSRLLGESIKDIKEHPTESAMRLADRLGCVVVSKDARTLICQSDSPVCMNTTGNSGMATAGSGDVLTGIIAGLLAQGMEAFEAASIGGYLHGLAGDVAADKLLEYGVTASSLIGQIGRDSNE